MAEHVPSTSPTWLEAAVFYQIYPQTYYDSNGDGIGDIPGITSKLDYIQSLGVTACWLNPCFVSPFQDAGYDVADYYQVAPRYGTNEDLRRLFIEARKRGIRILLDLVPGHTSIQHPWFIESCKAERNQYTDYYIWTDSAWTWEVPGYKVVSGYAPRDGCYITNFFYSQPALNYGFACPDPYKPWQQPVDAPGPMQVRQEIKNIVRFWLEMGASGFRVDMAASLVKADPGHLETTKFWQEIRTYLDHEFPEAALVSEWGNPSEAIPAGFHMDFSIPFGMPGYTALLRKPYEKGPGGDQYGFAFFQSIGHGNIMEFMDEYLQHYHNVLGKGFISIPTGNHDINPRLSKGRSFDEIELVFLFLLTMPGVPFVWYGDEIGMRSSDLPSKEGGYQRTGARTPMQWTDGLNAGFSSASPEGLYLPIDPSSDRPTVQQQKNDPASLLNRVRRLVSIRKSHSALQASASFDLLFAQPGKYPLVFQRADETGTFIVAVNPSAQVAEAEFPYPSSSYSETLYGIDGSLTYQHNSYTVRLPGISGGIYRITLS